MYWRQLQRCWLLLDRRTATPRRILYFNIPNLAFATDPPKGFRSFAWGAPVSSTLKRLTDNDGTSIFIPKTKKKPSPFLEVPVTEEAFSFTHGKFYSGSVWLEDRENFDKMKAALIKSFGMPGILE